jgi:AmpE protein
MSVALIATVVALVLGHLAQSLAAALRVYGWYGNWLRWLDAQFPEGSFWRGSWGIVVALLPPLLLVGLFQLALDGPLLGLAGLLFAIAVLFYTWGPRDLDLDVEAVIEASDPLARRDAVARLGTDGAPAALADSPLAGGMLVDAVFRSALRRWFGVLFWFLLLGPFGAVMYRLTALSAYGEISRALPPETAGGARRWLAVLEWPVAQLMTLALAIVGNFDTVLGAWRDNGGNALDLDSRFLEAVGRASVRTELAEEAADYVDDGNEQAALAMTGDLPELRDAMSLIWRTLLAWLALLALFVIAGFVN